MEPFLLIDFGSTYTKVTAIDMENEELLGAAQDSTTIEDDVRIGMNKALDKLKDQCGLGPDDFVQKFGSSSAAGGLKMVAIGLVPTLTLEAARRAALGAGAKVIASYGFELSRRQISNIEAMRCDIIMLAGGTVGGNRSCILHNAEMLANSSVDCPILVCGNEAAQDEIADMFDAAGKKYYLAENVLPEVDKVQIEGAQEIIRDIFVKHITKAKGLEHAVEFIGRDIIPTPKASLNAATLLAKGSKHETGIGSVLVVEVGGATINVHSVEEVKPISPQAIIRGLPEGEIKRTVEGDLGIRWNANTICELVGPETILDNLKAIEPNMDISDVDPKAITDHLVNKTSYKPTTEKEYAFDVALALSAADVAVRRHAGTTHKETISIGEVDIQRGKNLTEVRSVIGVGGIFRYGHRSERVLKAALYDERNPESMRPKNPKFYLDDSYVLYACGLLAAEYPDKALRIAKKYLTPVSL